jgi:hypothetical protein
MKRLSSPSPLAPTTNMEETKGQRGTLGNTSADKCHISGHIPLWLPDLQSMLLLFYFFFLIILLAYDSCTGEFIVIFTYVLTIYLS